MSWNKLEILCYSINGLYLIILFDGVSENKDAVSILQFIQLLKCATQYCEFDSYLIVIETVFVDTS